MSGAVETVAQFGPDRSLVGILTAPSQATAADRPAIVVMNTGITHRTGHHRIFVQWARALAAAGYAVLRFDQTGIGDSAGLARLTDESEAAQADLCDALDWMQAGGHQQFVLLGICSGADLALRYAGADRRVRGVVLLDPTLPTLRNFMKTKGRRVSQFAHLRALPQIPAMLMRQLRKLGGAVPPEGVLWAGPLANVSVREVRPFLCGIYGKTIEAEVQLLALLTEEAMTARSSRRIFARAFPSLDFAGRLHTQHLAKADHLLVRSEDRARALEMIQGWLSSTPFHA